jgi:hypothetical protein
MPTTLRSWIDQRVAALDEPVAQVLGAAAVLGARVDVDLLAAVVDIDEMTVLERCRPLLASGLLVEPPGASDLAFAHALTREAVVDGLGAAPRRLLHRRAAAAIRATHPDDVAALATHLSAAGPAVDDEAVVAMLDAADHALAQTAWSSARDWCDEVLARREEDDPSRVRAGIGRGAAERGLGHRDAARAALADALEGAHRLAEPRLVAEATLGLVGGGARGVSESMADEDRAQLLRVAIDGLGPDDDDLRIPLELELALALLLTDRVAERDALAADALARARRLGRPDLLGAALLGARVARPGPEHAERRLADAAEVLAMPTSSRTASVTMTALVSRHEDALLVGDRALARAALAEAEATVDSVDHPYWRWVVATWRTLDRVIDGDLDTAERLAAEALEWQADHPEAMACLGVNLVDIRLFQGRAAEVVDLLAGAAEDNPHIPGYRAVLALCRADSGDRAGAADAYRTFADAGFGNVPDDTNRLLTLAVLADVAATIGDPDGGAVLRGLLEPHAGRQVVLNCFAGGGAYWGPVATQLGRLATLLGDERDAAEHLATARAAAAAFDAPLALARIPT